MVKRGWAVVVTDYEGFGTPGVHTYVNRLASGHAVLDAARAARQPHTRDHGLAPRRACCPLRLLPGRSGHRLGCRARTKSYAPDLPICRHLRRAPPAEDLSGLLPSLDGSVTAGILGYVINSAGSRPTLRVRRHHPPHALTPDGEDLLAKTQNQCLAETMANFSFRHVQRYFAVDIAIRPPPTMEPFKSLFDQQRIGRHTPNAPVLIVSNRYDPLVPHVPGQPTTAVTGALRARMLNSSPTNSHLCSTSSSLNHDVPIVVDDHRGALQWIADRFADLPTTPNCGDI